MLIKNELPSLSSMGGRFFFLKLVKIFGGSEFLYYLCTRNSITTSLTI